MANKVVKEFAYPEKFGFTGSAGKTSVKGYMRGGKTKPEVREAVHKHEKHMHPGRKLTKI